MKSSFIAILMVLGISTSAMANQLPYADALEAFENADAPDMEVMKKKLTPMAIAIHGDQISKQDLKKMMKSKLQLKFETDALGRTLIHDPDMKYSFNNEVNKKVYLTLNDEGLRGSVDRGDHFFRLRLSYECRQLHTLSIICKRDLSLTGAQSFKLITVYKPVR